MPYQRLFSTSSLAVALLATAQAVAQDRDTTGQDCERAAADCAPAAADTRTTASEDSAELQRVTVTATRRPQALSSVPQKITVIDAEAIEQ